MYGDNIDIRFYNIDSRGDLEFHFSAPLLNYGFCPDVGDVLCHPGVLTLSTTFLRVLRRYYVEPLDGPAGWCVIVEKLDATKEYGDVLAEWRELNEIDRKSDEEEAENREARLQEALAAASQKRPTPARTKPVPKANTPSSRPKKRKLTPPTVDKPE